MSVFAFIVLCFDGRDGLRYITSDCGAESDVFINHHYTNTPEESVQQILAAGTDSDCGGFMGEHLQSALDKKLITEAEIDKHLKVLFRVRMRLGHFDPAGPLQKFPMSDVCSDYALQLSNDGPVQSTAMLKNAGGAPVFETRIRSVDQNICAGCKMCVGCACCKPKCCGLACFSCCGPCCDCCFACSSCCKCKSCFGCLKCCGPCCGPCQGCCEMACPACFGCIWGTFGGEPTYTIEKQPIFKPGKENTTPVGYIKSIWMENSPFSVTIDVPGATAEEQELLLILAYAIVEKTDPLDPSKVGFVHDQASNFTNPYFSTVRKGVKFDEVLKITTGGAPDVPEMVR